MQPNRLYFGDCLEIMQEYIPDESVDLIYLDPPFNSKRLYNAFMGVTCPPKTGPVNMLELGHRKGETWLRGDIRRSR